jgi:hypothetical protein
MSAQYFGFNSTQERTLRQLLSNEAGGSVSEDDLADGAVTGDKLANNSVTSAKIVDGTIVNADVSAAAALAASKVAVAAGSDGLSADDLQDTLQALRTYMVNLNTWAAALATKLNADAGVTDVNYDTNPQA